MDSSTKNPAKILSGFITESGVFGTEKMPWRMRLINEDCENRVLAEFLRLNIVAGNRFVDLTELPPELFTALRERSGEFAIGHVHFEGGTIAKLYQLFTNNFIRLAYMFKRHKNFTFLKK